MIHEEVTRSRSRPGVEVQLVLNEVNGPGYLFVRILSFLAETAEQYARRIQPMADAENFKVLSSRDSHDFYTSRSLETETAG